MHDSPISRPAKLIKESLLESEHFRQLFFLMLVLIGSLLFGTLGFYLIGIVYGYETWTFFHCAYMTMITLSTVGYGDVLGIDASGNFLALVFTSMMMMVGLGMVVYCMSQLTAIIVGGELHEYFKRNKMIKDIEEMDDHYIVCGVGNTGGPLLEELVSTGRKVVVMDTNLERLEHLHERTGANYIEGDCMDDDNLIAAGIHRAKGIFAILPEDKDNLFITVTARGLNNRLRIVSKAIDVKMSTKLVRSGANAVVSPNTIGGMRMASEMVRPSVVRFLDMMLRGRVQNRIEEINVHEGSPLDGKTIRDAKIHSKTGLLVVAILYVNNDEIVYNPSGNETISQNTILVVIGSPEQVTQARVMGTV